MFSKSTIKYIQSLQHKKFRDEYGVFVAEGSKVVTELLLSNAFECKAVYALKEWTENLDVNVARLIQGKTDIIADFELLKIANYSTANNVVAIFGKKRTAENIVLKNKLTLMLDDIQDPGNLGTIIRTADWFGIENIICSTKTVDQYNPKVVQSTMASISRVNVIYADLIGWMEKAGDIKKYAATLGGIDLHAVGPLKEGLIIIGNESKGIQPDIISLSDVEFTIPGAGNAESLNAAVAAGIILYAFTR